MDGKSAIKNGEGKFIVRLALPEWLVRKIVMEVRAANGKEVRTG